ncbi:hypothetical protein CK489_29080 [Bradyrhizobium sp. UFLA03-84]|uniref:hypothetical protein n=1 Tax=Bradyrhizobium sp. UFLA03-84 TaxID=418599 RepID=UPI000BADF0BC|nr:hypothetical protein [Bradyrhizobium sp. UFLA03-84]PAY05439.1 hypothetical protein CK489_29080 [Bradyrhizobium sp. UFLA03-84]
MTDAEKNQSKLDLHMALLARIVARFVSDGLAAHDIDSRGAKEFIGVDEDQAVFGAVLIWMLDEKIITARQVTGRPPRGPIALLGAQLTAKGLSIVRQPLGGGDTVETRIKNADGGNSTWSNIGDLIGGIAGGLIKSVSSG